jgi:O-antigen/teichoic acid export membrane protein
MFLFLRAGITSKQWFRTDAWLSVLDKLIMVLLCGIFLYFPSLLGSISIERFLLLQIGSLLLSNLITLTILLVKKFNFSFRKQWPDLTIFKAALPFAMTVLLMAFHSRMDGFLLERISSPEEAGKYAGAYRLLDAANMPGVLFAAFLMPYMARRWSEEQEIGTVTLNIRHFLMVTAITFSAIVVFLAPWIQKTLYHHTDASSIEVMQYCLPAMLGYSLVQVYGTVMTATGHIVAFSYITLIAVIINLALNILLIPLSGAKGSCIAALVSQGVSGIATAWYVSQKLKISINIRSCLIYIFIGALVSGFLYAADEWSVNKLAAIAGAGVIALIISLATRLVDFKSWKQSAVTNNT